MYAFVCIKRVCMRAVIDLCICLVYVQAKSMRSFYYVLILKVRSSLSFVGLGRDGFWRETDSGYSVGTRTGSVRLCKTKGLPLRVRNSNGISIQI